MNAGQIFVQMSVGAVPAAAVQAPTPAVSSPMGEQKAGAFARVLHGVSPRESARLVDSSGAGKSAQAKLATGDKSGLAPVQPDSRPDVPTTTLIVAGDGAQAVPSAKETTEETRDAEGSRICPEVQLPQNVVLGAAGSQVDAALQINGRMPETELENDSHGSQGTTAGLVEIKPLLSAATPQATVVAPETVMQTSIASPRMPVVAVPEKAAESAVAADRQYAVAALETAARKPVQEPGVVGRAAGAEKPVVATEVPGIVSTSMPRQDGSRITVANAEQIDVSRKNDAAALQVAAAVAQPKQDGVVEFKLAGSPSPAFTTSEQAGPVETSATPPLPGNSRSEVRIDAETKAVQSKITDAVQDIPETSLSAPEIPVAASSSVPAEKAVPEIPVRANLDAYFQTSVRPASVTALNSPLPAAQETAPLPSVDAQIDVHSAIDAAQRPARGEVRPHTEQMAAQDQPMVRQVSAEGAAKTEAGAAHAVTGVVKEVATTTPGEDSGRNGSGSGDQGMGSQAHMTMLHKVNQDNALPVTGTPAGAASDPLRTVQAEQIVGQVKEHLVGRDIKAGAEQVVIRLSPEHLGELKMNLRMENQCLKVEIVAETPLVRDALMKHSDSLKESLARQNITMESFDVSTGSNRYGSASHGQGQGQSDWRELARQRQSNAWASAGGYRLDTVPDVPPKPLYQASATHSMVDVHF